VTATSIDDKEISVPLVLYLSCLAALPQELFPAWMFGVDATPVPVNEAMTDNQM
jgi:hypothetical protein